MSSSVSRFAFGLFAAMLGYGIGMVSVPGPFREISIRTARAAVSYLEDAVGTEGRTIRLAPFDLTDDGPIRVSLVAPSRTNTPHYESPLSDYDVVRTSEKRPYTLVSTLFDAPLFDSMEPGRRRVGSIRRGFGVAGTRVDDSRCQDRGRDGVWYEIDGGFACSTSGFVIRDRDVSLDGQSVVEPEKPNLYRWARVKEQGAPRFSHRVNLQVFERGEDPGGLIERMEGDFFIAIRDEKHEAGIDWVETVRGNWVLKEDLLPKEPSTLSGEPIGEDYALPLAFAHEPIDTWCPLRSSLEKCGVMEKYARSTVVGYHQMDGREFAELMEGAWVRLDEIRVASAVDRPRGVSAGAKWVHFDLEEQTMVAYEGDEPVYATLISSGKEGHDTPTGLYRTERKYVSTTMRGRDPVEGTYHVEEVPWTIFYHGAYAVHGAYWHDTFGNVRSHGCTNLSVTDSRWLFHWEEFQVPSGWHAANPDAGDERRGHFYFTR